MKKTIIYISFLVIVSFVACIKNELKTYKDAPQAEIDLAAWNANGAGLTYPLINRVPAANRALTAGCPDSTLRRYSGAIQVRVNLIGAQSDKDETVGYKLFSTPVDSTTFPATLGFTCAVPPPASTCRQLPMTDAAPTPTTSNFGSCTLNFSRLAVFDAVAGVHYTALSGTVTIPKGSSFGYINIQVLNPGVSVRQARFIGIELDATGSIKPAVNYNKTGLLIDQR